MSGFDRQITVKIQEDAVFGYEIVSQELSLALHEDETTLLEAETERLQYLPGLVGDLQIVLSLHNFFKLFFPI